MPLLITSLLLTACGPTTSSSCPVIVDYKPDFQDKAYAEEMRLPKADPLRKMMDDYKGLRDQSRACANSQ